MMHELITMRFVLRRSHNVRRNTKNVTNGTANVSMINQKAAPGPSPADSIHNNKAITVIKNCVLKTKNLSTINKLIF